MPFTSGGEPGAFPGRYDLIHFHLGDLEGLNMSRRGEDDHVGNNDDLVVPRSPLRKQGNGEQTSFCSPDVITWMVCSLVSVLGAHFRLRGKGVKSSVPFLSGSFKPLPVWFLTSYRLHLLLHYFRHTSTLKSMELGRYARLEPALRDFRRFRSAWVISAKVGKVAVALSRRHSISIQKNMQDS